MVSSKVKIGLLLVGHVTEFNVTGWPMKGCVLVAPEGIEHDDRLNEWIPCGPEP